MSAPLTYVGTQNCASCHEDEARAFDGSHHDHAIEKPTRKSVLAPFGGEAFKHHGVTSSFEQKGDDFFVRTEGADGKEAEFRVAYTFGYSPLQQYLLEVGHGKLQSFVVAWDSRSQEAGGQRYFDLYPDEEVEAGDVLHWTGPNQNWNFTCADCHSTAFEKGYDVKSNSFESKWAELNVGCEACHGPGSRHLAWAKTTAVAGKPVSDEAGAKGGRGFVVDLQPAAPWIIESGAKSATPHTSDGQIQEIESCAPCHSRRQQLAEKRTPDQPYLDAYLPELLTEGRYHADGQIQDEVYVYGSFLQSRMFHAGVRCSDCHEPHSLQLRREGNDLCTSCHQENHYDSPQHHHHPVPTKGTTGADSVGGKVSGTGRACVDCHMPATTYMVVDPRRDHSIRIPRPDLSGQTGAPNACTGCHKEQSPKWAAEQLETWFGPERPDHYGPVFAAARRSEAGVDSKLVQLASDSSLPSIVRGSALLLLANYPGEAAGQALLQGSQSREALLRLGAVEGSYGLSPEPRVALLLPLLSDPLLAIRTQATRALVGIPPTVFSAVQLEQVDEAFSKLRATEAINADRADSWLRLALIDLGRGNIKAAQSSLEHALKLDPRFTPALVNLADLYRSQGGEDEAQNLLRRAIEIDKKDAAAWHALGLSLVRKKQLNEATVMLGQATQLQPNNARFHYVYAVALAETERIDLAIRALQIGLEHQPHDRLLLQTLMAYAKQSGDRDLAARIAAQLAGVTP